MSEIFIIIIIFGGLMLALVGLIKDSKKGYKSLSEAYRQWNEFSNGTPSEDSDYDAIRREILRKRMGRASPSPLMEKESYPLQPLESEVETEVEEPQLEVSQSPVLEQNYESVAREAEKIIGAGTETGAGKATEVPYQQFVEPVRALKIPQKESPRNDLLSSRIRKSLTNRREAQIALITGEILARPIALK
jgi:hypothetical protein